METWDKLCRACLTRGQSFTYYLFENVSAFNYTFCTSIEIKEDENLPKALCDVCYSLITQFSEFKSTCIKSQNLLLNQLKVLNENEIKNGIKLEQELITKLEPIIDSQNEVKKETGFNFKMVPISVDCTGYSETIKEESFHNENTGFDNGQDILISDSDGHQETKKPQDQHNKAGKRKRVNVSSQNSKWHLKKKKNFLKTCKICSKEFPDRKTYDEHILEHDGCEKAIYPCRFCTKTFATKSGLQRHRESKHSVTKLDKLKCKVCGRVCASRQSLQMHSKRHEPHTEIICHVCGRKCANDRLLKAHLETHAPDRERLHTCKHCGKKYFSNNTLISHITRLHKNNRYICDYCNYTFKEKQNLVKHITIHTGQKNYRCDICSKEFNKSSTLKEHKRTHSGERPHPCKFCQKSFISKRRVVEHQRVHTGEKPYKCDVCDHRFAQKGTMQRHAKIHLKSFV